MRAAVLPDFRTLHAALRGTTESLARELAQPSESRPDWSPLEWDVARASAAMHGIAAILARRLRWQGPQRWQVFLEEQLEHGLRREARVDSMLLRLDECLRHERATAVGLKGSSLRRLPLYGSGERPMGDIDLLAADADFPAVTRALAALGYAPHFVTRRHAVFMTAPPQPPRGVGEHFDDPLKIELHAHVAEELPVDPVDITAQLMPREHAIGLVDYPDKAGLISHLLLHAAGNMRAHVLRLVQLVDIALLAPTLTDQDWDRFLGSARRAAAPWWAFPPLLLAKRYCHAAIPDYVFDAVRAATPRLLQRAARRCTLNSVSWSNLQISAFPGIEWSRSMREALRFARTRMAPDREARAELDTWMQMQPHLLAIPWYGLSHGKRILRWMTGTAPRVQTMLSVMRALAAPTVDQPTSSR